jgi:hypothetical protein
MWDAQTGGWAGEVDRAVDRAGAAQGRPAGPVESICSFAIEANARWYAVRLARRVREAGITALRRTDIPAGPLPAVGLEEIMGEAIVGAGSSLVRGFLWLPRHARGRWRRIRTGRQSA